MAAWKEISKCLDGQRVLLASLGLLLLLAVTGLAQSGSLQAKVLVGSAGEVYENAAAERLVKEAKKFDPMYCPQEQRDRDKAALLYKQAIDAQPGAKYNAVLADRVAQLYTTEDKKKKVAPLPDKAVQWWVRCLELTSPKQLLWVQVKMSLARTAVIKKDLKSAAAAYDKILKIDANQIELEYWKFRPKSDRSKAQREREIERLQKRVWEIQNRALKEWRAAEKALYRKRPACPWSRWMGRTLTAQRQR